MQVQISPSSVSGEIMAPSSKSCTQRALAAALLYPGTSIVRNAGKSNDELAALGVIKTLGAKVEEKDGHLIITSSDDIFSNNPNSVIVNCGESGLSMRMFSGVAALFDRKIIMEGEGSILTRPMDFVEQYLPQLGVEVSSNGGKVPLHIKGPIHPADITVDGSLSSQFITGLLLAFCRAAREPVSIHVDSLTSRPYIDLTLDVLKAFGYKVENDQYESFRISPYQKPTTNPITYQVEGDWSNAAFLLVAAATASDEVVTLRGMDRQSTQGDKKVLQALEDAGVAIEYRENGDIVISPGFHLQGFEFDAVQCPDLFPPLVALAASCDGVSKIKGVHRLYHKESDRAKALTEEFGKMGVGVSVSGDEMIVEGGSMIRGAVVSSHNDHRIAMATAVAALNGSRSTVIEGAEAINKSYPGFYDDLAGLGGKLIIDNG